MTANSYNSFSELFYAGGVAMYPLLLCSVLSLSVAIERTAFWLGDFRVVSPSRLNSLLAFSSKNFDTLPRTKFSEKEVIARDLLERKQYEDAASLLEFESSQTFLRATSFLGILDCIVAVAPLLGILGTVLGIIQAFQQLNFTSGAIPAEVGQGLAEALITTAAGLLITIPSMVAHSLFSALARKKAIAIATIAERTRQLEQSLPLNIAA